MKKIFLLGLLGFSTMSFAHTCHISLYNQYNRPVLNFFSDFDPNCQTSANRCYQAIRAERLNPNYFKCYTVAMTPDRALRPLPRTQPAPLPRTQPAPLPRTQPAPLPRTQPAPLPRTQPAPLPRTQPTPQPRPQPAPTSRIKPSVNSLVPVAVSDSKRTIELGETVLFDNGEWIVTDLPVTGGLNLKPVGGKDKDIIENIPRSQIAITRGCHQQICSKDSVIDLATTQFLAVVGIDYNGMIFSKNVEDKKILTKNDPSALARTQGCVKNQAGELCAGMVVQNKSNLYFKLVGIQPDGNVVTESDDQFRTLTKNVNPYNLLPVR